MYRKRPSIPPEPQTLFGRELKRLMNSADSKKSIKDLADDLTITYEYARRLVRGINVPSKLLIQEVARQFHVDPKALESLAHRDRLIKEGILGPTAEMSEDHQLF